MITRIRAARMPLEVILPLLGVTAGSLIANLYYAQPLVSVIAVDLGLAHRTAGALTALTQAGYGLGLLLVVPLSDHLDNRRLVLTAMLGTVASLMLLAGSGGAAQFLLASLLLGLSCSAAQVLIPLIAHLAPDDRRDHLIGGVMGGIVAGVTLARPIALVLAEAFGWRAVFLGSAALIAVLWAALYLLLPTRRAPPR